MRQLIIWTGWGASEKYGTTSPDYPHSWQHPAFSVAVYHDCSGCGCGLVGVFVRVFRRVFYSILRASLLAVDFAAVIVINGI
jgi:hypothetical protein